MEMEMGSQDQNSNTVCDDSIDSQSLDLEFILDLMELPDDDQKIQESQQIQIDNILQDFQQNDLQQKYIQNDRELDSENSNHEYQMEQENSENQRIFFTEQIKNNMIFSKISKISFDKCDQFQSAQISNFDQIYGPKNISNISRDASPILYFQLIFTLEYLQTLCDYINKYHTISVQSDKKSKSANKSHRVRWQNITIPILQAFIGILLTIGINSLPNLDDYWSQSKLFSNLGIKEIISRDKFKQIKKYFILFDYEQRKQLFQIYGIWYQCEELKQQIIKNSNKYYQPKQELTIDEGMVKFSGYHPDRIYMPSKPIKYGFKVYILAESDSGFVLQYEIAKRNQDDDLPNTLMNKTEQICYKLLEIYKGKGHSLYFDSYYSSSQLFLNLVQNGFNACGTVKYNRLSQTKNSITSNKNIIQQWEPQTVLFFSYQDKLLLSYSNNKKPLYILSTFHSSTTNFVDIYNKILFKKEMQQSVIDKISRNINDVESLPLSQEIGVLPRKFLKNDKELQSDQQMSYNSNMRGVDRFDQTASYNQVNIRSKYPFMRVVYHLFEVAINNCYIIFQQNASKQVQKKYSSQLLFRKELIRQLVGEVREQNHILQSQTVKQKTNFQKKQECQLILDENLQKDTKKHCTHKKQCKKKTRYMCSGCDRYYCKNCYARDHNEKNCEYGMDKKQYSTAFCAVESCQSKTKGFCQYCCIRLCNTHFSIHSERQNCVRQTYKLSKQRCKVLGCQNLTTNYCEKCQIVICKTCFLSNHMQ